VKAILITKISEIEEPNRCGIVNPSKAYRALSRIVLDITYRCSLACPNCNRLCGAAPRNHEIGIDRVRQFVDDSIARNKTWEHIYIAGGEPSLHSDIESVLRILQRYIDYYERNGRKLLVKYFTNNHSPEARRVLTGLSGFIVVNSEKRDSDRLFKPVCVAPIDLGFYDDQNLRPCQELYQCGMAMNYRGYYPCAVAAAIDDVLLGGQLATERWQDVTFERMAEVLHRICRFCGHYFEPLGYRRESRLMVSATWERFFNGQRPDDRYQSSVETV